MAHVARPARFRYLMLVILLICGSATGCLRSKNLNAKLMGPPYEITAYENGRPVHKRKLAGMSDEEQALAHWIEANRKGWRPTFSEPTPSRVVKGDGFTMNFSKNSCVITIPPDPNSQAAKEGKPPMHLYKAVSPKDLELAEALK